MAEYRVRRPRGHGGDLFLSEGPDRMRWSHHHRELEVNVVLRGRAAYLFSEQRCRLLPGALLLIPPGSEHLLIRDTPRGAHGDCSFAMWVGVFGGEVIDHVRRILREEPEDERGSAECRDLLDSSRFILRYPEQDQLRLLLRLCEAAAEKKGPAYVARSSLAHLLMLTLELLRGAADVPHRRLTPAVRRFISLARSAAEQGFPMYVPDLCREAGVSHAHLCRLFGAEVGMPPGKYLDLLRLRSFLRMREERPDMPLETAAAGSGFRNYHHLYRTCLRETGAPPGRAGIMGVGQRAPN